MDCKSDNINSVIKEENQDLEFCFVVHVKVENDIEWPWSEQAPNEKHQGKICEEFEENNNFSQTYDKQRHNLAPKEDYQDEVSYAVLNENYQDNINYRELKQDFQTCLPKNDGISIQFANEKHQDKINFEELKQESFQTCMLCGKYFADSCSLFRHNLTHLKVPLIKRELFMCEHCPKYCKEKKDLEIHMLINHIRKYNRQIPITKQSLECLICKKMYLYKHWSSHMKQVHGQAKFKCKKCNSSFKCERFLKNHSMYVHEGVKRKLKKKKLVKSYCPECPAILDCKPALTTHLRTCHSKETYTCHLCNSTLKCKSYLLAHMKRVHHNDGIMHECKMCGKEFKSERYVRVHIKNSHTKKKP